MATLPILRFLLLAFALVEGCYGLMQSFGLCASRHALYPFTGSFYNPGPFACYLAITFPLAVSSVLRRRQDGIKWLGWGVLILDLYLIPASGSRTASLAALMGCVVAFYPLVSDKIKMFFYNRMWILIIGILLILGVLVISYKLKEASADGRFLIWKIACKAVELNPFHGSGWDRVAGVYGNAQEYYFASGNGTEIEKQVADAPAYVFNEFLQLSIAYGWGWSILCVSIFTGGFIISLYKDIREYSGCLLAAAIVMTASYPFQFQIFIVTIIILLIKSFLPKFKEWYGIGSMIVIVCGGIWLIKDCHLPEIGNSYNKALSLHNSGEWGSSNEILFNILSETSDAMPLIIIGKNYRELGAVDSAEYYFHRAVNRCPNRLYPHYQLMLLYADSICNRQADALDEAKLLLESEVKVNSPAVAEMRIKARQLVKNL